MIVPLPAFHARSVVFATFTADMAIENRSNNMVYQSIGPKNYGIPNLSTDP